ncbi:MAG: type II toxin-antitoxin system VapC family toxin [Acetobacteraceae bacterium]
MLARAQIRGFLAGQTAFEFLQDLTALEIQVDMEGADHILTEVHRLAIAYRLTSYDAAYLELAARRTLPLATLDQDLLAACKASGVKAFDAADLF